MALEQQQQAAAQAVTQAAQQAATELPQDLNHHVPCALLAESQRHQLRTVSRNAQERQSSH